MSPSETSIPHYGSRFIGRDDVSDRLAALLESERLVTVLGAAGVGKSRLVCEVARNCWEDREVAFVDLTSTRSAEGVAAAIAATLGLSPESASQIPEMMALPDQRCELLILDNVEHVVGVASELVERVVAGGACRVVCTSRVPLRLGAEHRFHLEPLAEDDALALLEARVDRLGVELDPGDLDELREIARRVDFLPLALELAASRLVVLSPSDLFHRLQSSFDILRTTGPEETRHDSLAAAIEISWQVLGSDEKRALQRLSLFTRPFAMAEVSPLAGANEEPMEDVVQRLIEDGLVSRQRIGGAMLFDMFEAVREYASGKLRASDDYEDALRRRTDAVLAESAESLPVSAVDDLQQLYHRVKEFDPARAVRLALLTDDLLERGHIWGTRVRLLGDALDLDDHDIPESHRIRLRQRKVYASGFVARRDRADLPPAQIAEANEVVADARSLGNDAVVSASLNALGALHSWNGDYEGAIELFGEAAELDERCDEPTLKARVNLCIALIHAGRVADGMACADEAIARAKGLHMPRMQARLLALRAGFNLETGRTTRAALDGHAALELLEEQDDRRFEAMTQRWVGTALTRQRDKGAIEHLEKAVDLARKCDVIERLVALLALADAQSFFGMQFGETLVEARELRPFLGSGHSGLLEQMEGVAALRNDDPERAARSFAAARRSASAAGCSQWEALMSICEAHVHQMAGASGEAHRCHARAEPALASSSSELFRQILARSAWNLSIEGAPEAPRPDWDGNIIRLHLEAGILGSYNEWSSQLPAILEVIERGAKSTTPRSHLSISPEARTVRLPTGETIDLSRRGPVRRVLAHLADKRVTDPGCGVAVNEVFDAGWSGESVSHETALNRVYNAIATLRETGLEEVLITRDDGYLLDPAIPFERAADADD